MNFDNYIEKTLFILNEQEEGTVFAGNTSIRNIIEKVYPDAWKQLLSTLPKNWFKTNTFKHYPIVDGAVILPKDFYRLYSFKMTGWKNKAFETVEENSEKALLQQNEYTRGGIVRPVCVLARKQPDPNIINAVLVEADSDTEDFEYLVYNNNLYYVQGHLKGLYDEETEYSQNDIYYRNGELYKVLYTSQDPAPTVTEGLLVEADTDETDFTHLIFNSNLYEVTGHCRGEYNGNETYSVGDIFYDGDNLILCEYTPVAPYLATILEPVNEGIYTDGTTFYEDGQEIIYNVLEILNPANTGMYTDGENYYSNGEIIDYEPGLMDVMEVYPIKETIEEALYIPNPANDDEISEKLFEPLCKTAAQLVYIILEKEVKLW